MNKNIFYTALVILVLAGLMVWGKVAQKNTVEHTAAQDAGETLTASETLYDFGEISMKDGNVSHDFTITNTTGSDIFIKKLMTSCMCTAAYIEDPSGELGPFGMEGMGVVPPVNRVLKAGDSLTIKAVYNPNAHGPAGVGRIDRFVMLTDGANNEIAKFEIKANVTP